MSTVASRLSANIARVGERVRAACDRAGRDPSSVRLITVTKYARLAWVAALIEQGLTTLGESRPQQLAERATILPRNVEWHLVGHLQRNKVRLVLPHVALIHSVDSVRLLRRINAEAAQLECTPRVLLEVNVSGEATKHGFAPAGLSEEWSNIVGIGPVAIDGLMTMAPATDDPETARVVFRELRALRDQFVRSSPATGPLTELSMGMSGDFEIAIEEGATLIRLGGALFDGLAEC